MLRKIRLTGMIIIAFGFTPFGVIYFIATGTNTHILHSIGVVLFGLFTALIFGIVMLLVEKVLS